MTKHLDSALSKGSPTSGPQVLQNQCVGRVFWCYFNFKKLLKHNIHSKMCQDRKCTVWWNFANETYLCNQHLNQDHEHSTSVHHPTAPSVRLKCFIFYVQGKSFIYRVWFFTELFIWASCSQLCPSSLLYNWKHVDSAFPGKDYNKFSHWVYINICLWFATTQTHLLTNKLVTSFFLINIKLNYTILIQALTSLIWLPQSSPCAMFPNNFLKIAHFSTISILFEHSKFKSQEFFIFSLK